MGGNKRDETAPPERERWWSTNGQGDVSRCSWVTVKVFPSSLFLLLLLLQLKLHYYYCYTAILPSEYIALLWILYSLNRCIASSAGCVVLCKGGREKKVESWTINTVLDPCCLGNHQSLLLYYYYTTTTTLRPLMWAPLFSFLLSLLDFISFSFSVAFHLIRRLRWMANQL